jgi:hypothetical protein
MHTKKTIQINHNRCVYNLITCKLNDILIKFISRKKLVVFPPLLNLKWMRGVLNLKWGEILLIFAEK